MTPTNYDVIGLYNAQCPVTSSLLMNMHLSLCHNTERTHVCRERDAAGLAPAPVGPVPQLYSCSSFAGMSCPDLAPHWPVYKQTRIPNVFSTGIEQVLCRRDKCLNHLGVVWTNRESVCEQLGNMSK
jgi:hypothetical protein